MWGASCKKKKVIKIRKNRSTAKWTLHYGRISKFCPIINNHFCLLNQKWYSVTNQNCSDLMGEKNFLLIEKNFWNSRLKAESLQNFRYHLNNLFKQWKVRTTFGNRMLFDRGNLLPRSLGLLCCCCSCSCSGQLWKISLLCNKLGQYGTY